MKAHIFSTTILLSIIMLTAISCDKYHAKKLAGTYACKVRYIRTTYYEPSIDSTYYEDITIKQDGKNVIILGTPIHIDSLWKGKKYYQGYIHDYMEVQFKKDSVFITKSGGGLGGNVAWVYSGLKK